MSILAGLTPRRYRTRLPPLLNKEGTTIRSIILLTKERADHKHIHLRPQETFDRFGRQADDRLVLVEARIEDDRVFPSFASNVLIKS